MPRKQHTPRSRHHRAGHVRPVARGSRKPGWKVAVILVAAVAGVSSTQLLASGIHLTALGAPSAPVVTAAPGDPVPTTAAAPEPANPAPTETTPSDAPTQAAASTPTAAPTTTAEPSARPATDEPTTAPADPAPPADPTATPGQPDPACISPILRPLPATAAKPPIPEGSDSTTPVTDPASDPTQQAAPTERRAPDPAAATGAAAPTTATESGTTGGDNPTVAPTQPGPSDGSDSTANPPPPSTDPTPAPADPAAGPTGDRLNATLLTCTTTANAGEEPSTMAVVTATPLTGRPTTLWLIAPGAPPRQLATVSPTQGTRAFRILTTDLTEALPEGSRATIDTTALQIWTEAQR